MKKVIVGIVGAVVVLGGGIGGYVAYENHQETIAQQQADQWYQNDFMNNGVDTSSDKTTPASGTSTEGSSINIDEVKSIFKQQIGKDFTPDMAEGVSGYIMDKMENHKYLFRQNSSSKDYLIVTFNSDENTVISVVKD